MKNCLCNLQGDIIGLYDAYGRLQCRYTYDTWGAVVAITDAEGNAITDQSDIAHQNPFRYRGYYYDSETGLYYLQSRYYNPQWGRFLNADILFIAGEELLGSNMFAYCGNNPVMGYDPSGMNDEDMTFGQSFAQALVRLTYASYLYDIGFHEYPMELGDTSEEIRESVYAIAGFMDKLTAINFYPNESTWAGAREMIFAAADIIKAPARDMLVKYFASEDKLIDLFTYYKNTIQDEYNNALGGLLLRAGAVIGSGVAIGIVTGPFAIISAIAASGLALAEFATTMPEIQGIIDLARLGSHFSLIKYY